MALCKYPNSPDGFIFQCSKCWKQIRIKNYLNFDKRTLPINIWFLILTEHYAKGLMQKNAPYSSMPNGFAINYKVTLKVFIGIRSGIVAFIKDKFNQGKLRGIVEIDESLVSHRTVYYQQHHVRQLVRRVHRQIWLVGLY